MKMLINGKWVDRKEKIEVRDPWDDTVVDTVPSASAEDVETALASAAKRPSTSPSSSRTIKSRKIVCFYSAKPR